METNRPTPLCKYTAAYTMYIQKFFPLLIYDLIYVGWANMAPERLQGTLQELLVCFLDGPKDVFLGPCGGKCREVQWGLGEGCDANIFGHRTSTINSSGQGYLEQ